MHVTYDITKIILIFENITEYDRLYDTKQQVRPNAKIVLSMKVHLSKIHISNL